MNSKVEHRPSILDRRLTLVEAVLLTLSVVTPASSMFIIVPSVIGQAGTGVIISLLLAVPLGLIVALVYAELASFFGSAGGEYVYTEKVFGEIPAYPIIIVNLITQTFITSVLALGAGDYFQRIMPINPTFSALIVVAFATLFGVLHIKTNAVITGMFFLVELAALVAVSYFGLRNLDQGVNVIYHPVVLGGSTLTATPFFAIAMATAAALFAFNGYEQAIYINEEIKGTRITVAHAILIAFVFAIVLETIPTVLTLLASRDIPRFVDPSINPYIDLVDRVAGARWVVFISAAVSLAVLNACIANVLLTARFLFSTARSGAWGDRLRGPLTALNTQSVPVLATLVVGVLGAAACFVPINTLFVLTGTGLVFIYATLCLVVVVNRRRSGTSPQEGKTGGFRMPFISFLPAVGFLGLVGVLVANWADPVLGRPSIIASFGEILLGLLIWLIMRKVLSAQPLNSETPE